MTVLIILLALIAVVLILTYIIYRIAFVVNPKGYEMIVPKNEDLQRQLEGVVKMRDKADALPYEDVWTTSYDGLKLHARFYPSLEAEPSTDSSSPEAASATDNSSSKSNSSTLGSMQKSKIVEIFFHGYMSSGINDLSGGLFYSREQGVNAILVDQRGHRQSEGKCLTMAVKESRDVVSWSNFAVNKFGSDVKIFVYGLSMGGATVLESAARGLPENVVGIIDDCGYTTPKDMVDVMADMMHLPRGAAWVLAWLAGKLWGNFDMRDCDTVKAMEQNEIPVLFVHGEADEFVPYAQGRRNYEACKGRKVFLSVPNAGHGMSWINKEEEYKKAIDEFMESVL